MRKMGLEPTRCNHHKILSLARLPVPTLPRFYHASVIIPSSAQNVNSFSKNSVKIFYLCIIRLNGITIPPNTFSDLPQSVVLSLLWTDFHSNSPPMPGLIPHGSCCLPLPVYSGSYRVPTTFLQFPENNS